MATRVNARRLDIKAKDGLASLVQFSNMRSEIKESGNCKKVVRSKFYWIRLFGFFLFLIVATLAYPIFEVVDGMYLKADGTSADDKTSATVISDLESRLRKHVYTLADTIGERHFRKPEELAKARDYIENVVRTTGLTPQRQEHIVYDKPYQNISAEIHGRDKADEIIILGAHYDSANTSPGANDDGTGVAAGLELVRLLNLSPHKRTIRFVTFPTHEHLFSEDTAGSFIYASECKRLGENVVAMIALETIGYYSDVKGSQHYPCGLGAIYPDQANFIAFVSNLQNKSLVKDVLGNFRHNTKFPALGIAIPEIVPGVGWSDHRFFWACDFPAMMVTDTALFRDPFYHTSGDKADTVNYIRLAQVVDGLAGCVKDIADR